MCASSSTTATSGLRARTASRSISSTATPRYSMRRRGTTSRPVDQRRGLGAAVRLDEAEHDVDAALLQRVRLLEHAVGLADARGEADVELEPAALRALDELEEVLRPASLGGRGREVMAARMADLPPRPGLRTAGRAPGSAQHVHARLAEEAEVAPLDLRLDQRLARAPRDTPRARATRGTCQSAACGREVRVEPAGRGGDELRRDGAGRVRDSPSASRCERRPRRGRAASRGRPEVRAARGGGVVALLARRRRARLEVAGRGEALADQLRADDLPGLVGDEAAVRPGAGRATWASAGRRPADRRAR